MLRIAGSTGLPWKRGSLVLDACFIGESGGGRYDALNCRAHGRRSARHRLDTDIIFGQNNGLLSCLTLSGVTTEAKLLSAENQIKPDYCE